MNQKGGTVTFDAEEYLKLLDELKNLEKRLRSLGSNGFNSGTTSPPRPDSREKKEEEAAMEIDLDISGIEWKLSNRDGGGPAGPEAGWAWAFAYTQNGGICRETVQLTMALEQYGRVRVGPYEIELSGRDNTLLARKKWKK